MTIEALTVFIRALLYIDLLVLFGLLAFGLYGLHSIEHALQALPLRRGVAALAAVGLVLSVIQIVVMASAMAGTSVLPVNVAAVHMLVTKTQIGIAWTVRMVALFSLLPVLLLVKRSASTAIALLSAVAAVAVGTLAWAGHGAMDSGSVGWIHLGADVLHLLAAAGWVGAVLALCILLFRRHAGAKQEDVAQLYGALLNFASMGTVFVGVILVTGIVNVWVIVGVQHVLALPDSDYGRLLIGKLALFLAMLCLAAANRFRLSPALGRARLKGNVEPALRALRISLFLEIGSAFAILVVAAWLGTLAPTK